MEGNQRKMDFMYQASVRVHNCYSARKMKGNGIRSLHGLMTDIAAPAGVRPSKSFLYINPNPWTNWNTVLVHPMFQVEFVLSMLKIWGCLEDSVRKIVPWLNLGTWQHFMLPNTEAETSRNVNSWHSRYFAVYVSTTPEKNIERRSGVWVSAFSSRRHPFVRDCTQMLLWLR